MEIHALCLVQNEADVVGESLPWAARFCDRVWVWDLGSSDDTFERIEGLASPSIQVSRPEDLPFSRAARPALLAGIRARLPVDSWLYVLDADEFLAADPRPLLEAAAASGAHLVRGLHCNFYPTPGDVTRMHGMGVEAWEALPLFERLRHFRIEEMERRFVRLSDDLVWEGTPQRSRMRLSDGARPAAFRGRPLIRHYRYRGPTQVAKRFETRGTVRERGYEDFPYDRTGHFESYVRRAAACRRWPDGPDPPELRWSDVARCHAARLRAALRKARRPHG